MDKNLDWGDKIIYTVLVFVNAFSLISNIYSFNRSPSFFPAFGAICNSLAMYLILKKYKKWYVEKEKYLK